MKTNSLYNLKHFREERSLNAISFSRCNVRGGAKDPFEALPPDNIERKIVRNHHLAQKPIQLHLPSTAGNSRGDK
ncbi:hypothetical protein OUZ56_016825 [Daphnia magna]|uniref:Uncharacterized protein n=1 Tax=Daphnia magna TaxID=35525 RepID=A0ABR0AS37_9CRUS|nr:hypothetical protein OUZ56_016825 [Daphnia magna]